MTSWRRVRRVGTLGALALVVGAIAWRAEVPAEAHRIEPDPQRVGRLIAALDAAVQERFKEVDERFGMRRVVTIGETPHVFRPKDATELSAVKALDEADLRVVLYLSGRIGEKPNLEAARSKVSLTWRLVKGPVEMTGRADASATAGAEPPHPLDLWDDSRRALQTFSKSDVFEFERGAWRFVARPVRASDASCLQCHAEAGTTMMRRPSASSTLKIGDALGVVLYGYPTARQ